MTAEMGAGATGQGQTPTAVFFIQEQATDYHYQLDCV
jgi:hypothetical protein